MKQVNAELAVLQEISSVAVREKQADVLLETVLDILNRKMGMLRATFTLRQGDRFVIEASQGLDDDEKRRGCYHLGEGITGRVAQTGKSELVPDIDKAKGFLNLTGARKIRKGVAFLCVPVFRRDQVIGTLSIDRKVEPGVDLEADLRLLEIIGNLMAEAVEASRQMREEREALLAENRRLREALEKEGAPPAIIGKSNTMQRIYELIRQVAPSDATVLLRGNSGTGKELAARAIQELSTRANKPFIILNCGALPENLVESELFGHEKGAFTGAMNRRVGRAEAANGGTLFLDEIGDLGLPIQVKLLRFIQERTFSRIGSNEELKTDVRLIAATSRNLEQLMAEGRFREDLYYRLNVFPIVLPDLSRRRSDILLLADHFVEKFNLRYGKNVSRLSTPAINLLMAYHWPGNVRELENCIERAVLTTTDGSIHSYNLPPSLQASKPLTCDTPDAGVDFTTRVDAFERELITDALKYSKGNMSAAARELGLSPRVMHYKINRLGIASESYKESGQ